MLCEGLGKVLQEGVENLLLFGFVPLQASLIKGFQNRLFSNVLPGNGDNTIKIDDAAADVLGGPELGTFDAIAAIPNASPRGVEY